MIGFSRQLPPKDDPCCRHDTSECQRYRWWIKQTGKTVRVTQGAFAGYEGRLTGTNFTHGIVSHRAGCQLHASWGTIVITYADLEVVRGGGPPECCGKECCCGPCDRCGAGLMGGECVAECRKVRGHPDLQTVEEHAKRLTKLVLFSTAYGSREQTAARVQEHLERYFHTCGCPSWHDPHSERTGYYLEQGCRGRRGSF
jgi:hypothetical protein